MKPHIYNFFKFLNQREQRPIPFKAKLIYTPETLTPQELNVKGDLDLSNTPITSLPEGLTVDGWLDLTNTEITFLPKEGLTVGRNLWLRNTKITSLPKGLTVGGSLDLTNTKITSLPEDLKVEYNLYLANAPLAKQTKREIRAMIGPNGYINGKIIR